MNTMTYRGYAARIEYSDEDECFFGHIAGITDIIGFHGNAVAELRDAFHSAVDDYLETCAKAGINPNQRFMRTLATIIALIVLVAAPLHALAASSSDSSPHDARIYDRQGRYQGRVTYDGQGQTRVYDKSGRYQGRTSSSQDKTVRIYDKDGRYQGRVTVHDSGQ